jgi:glycosyltransferase involved in cell wall biosynthesis
MGRLSKPVTVLYIIDTCISPLDKAPEGGAEKQLYLLSTSLDPVAFRPIVVQLTPRSTPSVATDKLGAVEPLHFPTEKFYNLHGLHQIVRLGLLAKRQKVDIIHTFFEKSEVMGWLITRFSHVPVWITSRRDLGFLRKKSYREIFKISGRNCNRCVANCHAVKNKVIEQENLPDEKVSVIYNGLDFSYYMRPSNGNRIRNELGVENKRPIVGMIANFNFEIKGHHFFIEASKKILDEFPDTEFVLVGDGSLRCRYEKMAQDFGIKDKIHFLGKREDVPEILSSLNISISCSTSEGFSNVILESMAAGKPVISTSVGGSSEIVVNGVTGYLVPPADPDALARAVTMLLQNPGKAAAMGAEGKKIVHEKFTVDSMVKNYEKLYTELVEEYKRAI